MSLSDSQNEYLHNTKGHRQTRWDQPLPQCGSTTVTQSSTVYCDRWTTRRNLVHSDVSIEPLTNGTFHARLNRSLDEKYDSNVGTEGNVFGSCNLNNTRLSEEHISHMNTEVTDISMNCKHTRNHNHSTKCTDVISTRNTNKDIKSQFYCGVKFKTPCIGLHMAMRGERIKLRKYMLHENNIGHQLLVKQGWRAGQGLGKSLQGRVDPVPITVREEIVGFGKMQMEMERAEETTERRRPLECEKENTAELQQKYKENVDREYAKQRSLADMKASFYCGLCDKQYSKHTEYDNHMDSYDHAHKQRLKELRQKEIGWRLRSKRRREEKQMKREMLRINEYAQSRINQTSRGASSVSSSKEPSSEQPDVLQFAKRQPGSVYTRDPTYESPPEELTCEKSLNESVDSLQQSSQSSLSYTKIDMTPGNTGKSFNNENNDTQKSDKVSTPRSVSSDISMHTALLSQNQQLSNQSILSPTVTRQINDQPEIPNSSAYPSTFEGGDVKDNDELASFLGVQNYDQTQTRQWPAKVIKMTPSDPKICYSCNPLYFDDSLLSCNMSKSVDTLRKNQLTKVSKMTETSHYHIKERKKKHKRNKSSTGVGDRKNNKYTWIKAKSPAESEVIKNNSRIKVLNMDDEMVHHDSYVTHRDASESDHSHSSQHSSSSSESHKSQRIRDSNKSNHGNSSYCGEYDSDYSHYCRSFRPYRKSRFRESQYSQISGHSSRSKSRLCSYKRDYNECHRIGIPDKLNVSPETTSPKSVIHDDPVEQYATGKIYADDKQTDVTSVNVALPLGELECIPSSSPAKLAHPLPAPEEHLQNIGHINIKTLSVLPNGAKYPENPNKKFIYPKKRTVLNKPSILKQLSPSPNPSPCPALIAPHTISSPPQPCKLSIQTCTYSPLMVPIIMKTVSNAPGIPHHAQCTPMASFLHQAKYEQHISTALMAQHQHMISNGSLLNDIRHVNMAHQSIETGLDVSQTVGLYHSMDQLYTGLTHNLNPAMTSLMHPVHSAPPGMIQPRPILKPQMVLTSALPIRTILPSCHQVGVVQ